jgi:hypothetical protein
MDLGMWAAVAAGCMVLAAVGWKLWIMKVDKATLERQIEELLIISDSLNRTEGRRARKIAWRDKSIGDLVRELPAVGAERDG